MCRLFIILGFAIFTSCSNSNGKVVDLTKQESNIYPLDRARLHNYLQAHEIDPSIVINNTQGNQTEIQLSKYTIKWLNTDEETKIKIDNDRFTLQDKATLNIVWQTNDSVDFANNWDQIKFYKFKEREIIGIRMSFRPCTGLGCNVDYFLVYDILTKKKNFFGTFRTDNQLALYNFDEDDMVDYVSKTYNGDAHGSTSMESIYELYSMHENGLFVQKKNTIGSPYRVKQTTYPNDKTKTETFEQQWITEIK